MPKPNKNMHFVLDVDLTAHWPDSSFLRTNPSLTVPLPRQGHTLEAEEVVSLAGKRTELLLQTVLDAKFKTRPSNFELSLSLSAYYPDGREADKRLQLSESDPNHIVSRVERWYKDNLQALVDIGTDDI